MTIKLEIWGTDLARLLLLVKQDNNPNVRIDCVHVRSLADKGLELMATNGSVMVVMRAKGHLDGADLGVVRVPKNLRSKFAKDGTRLLVTGPHDAVLKTRKGGVQIGDSIEFDAWFGYAGLRDYVDWRRVATPPSEVQEVTGLVRADALGLLEDVLGPSKAMRVLASSSKPDLCFVVPQRSIEFIPNQIEGFGVFYMHTAKEMQVSEIPEWATEAA